MDIEIFQLNKIQNDPTIIYFNIPDILQTVPDINSLTIAVKHFFPRWKDIPWKISTHQIPKARHAAIIDFNNMFNMRNIWKTVRDS